MDGIWEGKTISQFLRSGLGARRALGKNVAQNAVLYSAAGALVQIAFKTPAPALTAQVNCAYAYAAASHADAWLAEHFQKQNA
ncbi:hypothetical protein V6C53_16805, partial [Desulfocurvibacter africanus]|uniref:hypothetical protein n=1 Tax=Desulfocurvibacter africanus TaxID=873 RepID=UPI002FDB55A4